MNDGEQYRQARRTVDDALERGRTLEEIERQLERPELALRRDQRDALWLYAEGRLALHRFRRAEAREPAPELLGC